MRSTMRLHRHTAFSGPSSRSLSVSVRAPSSPVVGPAPCRAYLQAEATEPQQTEEARALKARQEVTRRIKALGEAGRVREAIQALAGLAPLNVQPDTLAATALVQACCKDMDTAQSVFDSLFGDFLQPDEVSFAVLLRGYGAGVTPNWPKIDATLTAMRTMYDIRPTAVSYNVLLELCCRTTDLERGQDIIDRMAADGVSPNRYTDDVVAKKRVLRSYLHKMLQQR